MPVFVGRSRIAPALFFTHGRSYMNISASVCRIWTSGSGSRKKPWNKPHRNRQCNIRMFLKSEPSNFLCSFSAASIPSFWRCHKSGRSPPWSIPCRNGGRAGFDLMHPAPQWLSSDFQAGGSNRCIFHGTLDTIPAGQRRFKRIFTQMPCARLFL